ncbi:681_t:CDS:2 [Funneliformis caledonium]|uniref:681_t:CDS:1 n=1 Tax=Funneliformis caledonium TaxID=1117310 RepID=A0A9N8YL03_9GLOM|nr:681_t:CDS:2 [Funneliformis caledonium]
MNVTKEIQRINSREIERNISVSGSWHAQYRDSPYIFVGNIPFDLTEGDIITIFSQYGEILDIQLVRNRETGESKGFGFLRYEDQRSTILAVDNLNNFTLLGRTLRVDHASAETKDGEKRTGMNAAPPLLQRDNDESGSDSEDSEDIESKVDPDDPMREFIIKKLKKERKKAKKKAKKEKKKRKRNEDDEVEAKRNVTRERSRSWSRERNVTKERSRSWSRERNVTRERSRSWSRFNSRDDVRGREKRRVENYTRERSRSRSRSRGRDYDRNRRVGSVTRYKSRSRSRSRSRNHGRGSERSYR